MFEKVFGDEPLILESIATHVRGLSSSKSKPYHAQTHLHLLLGAIDMFIGNYFKVEQSNNANRAADTAVDAVKAARDAGRPTAEINQAEEGE